jgi:SpoIIAA-like
VRRVRIVLEFPSFDGISVGATWQDLKMGVEHLFEWKRIALVTDVEWMIHVTRLFGWMTPGELRRFPLSERNDTVAWAAAG